MPIKIDKKVKIPEAKARIVKYAFGDMKVGDSFLMFEEYNRENVQKASAAYSWYSREHKKSKWKFTQRKTEEGIRVWRIK